MRRLTPQERADREILEDEFRRQVDQLAEIYGWTWMHVDPLQTRHGWRVPTHGPLGKGWPDSIYVHERRQRVLAVEFKREGKDPTYDQELVLQALAHAGLEVAVWRPSDLTSGLIQEVLAR